MSSEAPQPPPIKPPPSAVPPQPVSQPQQTSFVDVLIPAKNSNALLSYYLGLFSIFPLFGLVMGIVAIWSGRKGLAAIKETPGLAGGTHAKVGIGCGAIGFLFNLGLILLFLAALLFGNKQS